MKDAWVRIGALIERDMRRFRRSPTLVIVSMVMPLVQLVILGYAFGGNIKNLNVGVVDQDYREPAVRLKGMLTPWRSMRKLSGPSLIATWDGPCGIFETAESTGS